MNPQQNELIKSGMVALVGPPNVGKSTLLNSLLGQKISIVSAKPQTTRNRILGILNDDAYQIVLIDTPGLHKAESLLNKEMVRIALESLSEVDVVVFMIDATSPVPKKKNAPTRYLDGNKTTTILLINKVDLLNKERILPIIKAYGEMYNFNAIIPISALNNDGTDLLLDELIKKMPEGPRYYPEDIPTDCTERFIVEEIIREKVFRMTGQEIPYSSAVVIERFKEDAHKGIVIIDASIILEKKSQKGIVIGKGGKKIQQIGTAARIDIEKLLDQKVLLKLWVKIQKNWTKNPKFLKELGL